MRLHWNREEYVSVSAVLEFDGDIVVIVLSNYDAPIAESIARALMEPLETALE